MEKYIEFAFGTLILTFCGFLCFVVGSFAYSEYPRTEYLGSGTIISKNIRDNDSSSIGIQMGNKQADFTCTSRSFCVSLNVGDVIPIQYTLTPISHNLDIDTLWHKGAPVKIANE